MSVGNVAIWLLPIAMEISRNFTCGHFHMQINAVEPWPGNAAKIILNLAR